MRNRIPRPAPAFAVRRGARIERCQATEGTPLSPPLVNRGPRPQPPKAAQIFWLEKSV